MTLLIIYDSFLILYITPYVFIQPIQKYRCLVGPYLYEKDILFNKSIPEFINNA